MSSIGPNIGKYVIIPLPWQITLGWKKGTKLFREQMCAWCETQFPDRPRDWDYDRGGNWYFKNYDDAVAFYMVWG